MYKSFKLTTGNVKRTYGLGKGTIWIGIARIPQEFKIGSQNCDAYGIRKIFSSTGTFNSMVSYWMEE